MLKKKERFTDLGDIKRVTNIVIDDALGKQLGWRNGKSNSRTLIPARKNKEEIIIQKKIVLKPEIKSEIKTVKKENNSRGILAYWFPILCVAVIIILLLWVFASGCTRHNVAAVPEPTTKTVSVVQSLLPTFDVVRIEDGGKIVIAGRYVQAKNVSIKMNNKIVATEMTDINGEFVYTPATPFAAGNYTIQLIAVDTNKTSINKVFIYVSERGAQNSLSLLMTSRGSTLLQSPKLMDGDLVVSKIDYLTTGRIVVTGTALPRLRVTLHLDDKELGFSRVSDHKNYGLGADVGTLKSGTEYKLSVKLHDGDGRVVSTITHKFVMPSATGADDTFYTVRRDDCLWIISRNFLGRGVLFSIIAEKNNIKNPDLIYPNQKLQIPVK